MAMNLTSGLVGAEARGPIGWLIWDNPSKLNALSPGMSEDALSVIETYEADPEIKVVIMRGAGRKAFISGGDIDRKSTRLNSSHQIISYAVFCLKKKQRPKHRTSLTFQQS